MGFSGGFYMGFSENLVIKTFEVITFLAVCLGKLMNEWRLLLQTISIMYNLCFTQKPAFISSLFTIESRKMFIRLVYVLDSV